MIRVLGRFGTGGNNETEKYFGRAQPRYIHRHALFDPGQDRLFFCLGISNGLGRDFLIAAHTRAIFRQTRSMISAI
jgi:hypothetical protein